MVKIPIDKSIWQDLSVDERIDVICDTFETAWKEGKSPKVAEYAALMDSSSKATLLRELMLVSRECREIERQTIRLQKPQPSTLSVQSEQIDTDLTFLSAHKEELPQNLERELPTNFGDYILMEVLGRGSFGLVYRAESTLTGGEFALKIPHPALVADPDNYQLFVRESRNVAGLKHPGVVKVYNVEYEDRIPFLVSELVAGKNLKDLLALTGKFPPLLAANFVLQLAETVDYSHRKGVIHRDIKPSNIIVENSEGITALDEGLTQLKPRLLDFGIAKLHGSNTLVTQSGVVLGTPSYMSPEQARGDSSLVTPQSDIYSLGAVLFELLCGSPPFQGEPSKVIQKVQSEDAPLLVSRDPSVAKELSIICDQSMRLVPSARYASAACLADDLRRFLNDEPIHGRTVPLLERLAKRIRKHSAAWAVATAATMVVIACLALAWRSNTTHRNLAANLLASDPNGREVVAASNRLEDWLLRAPQSFGDSSPLINGIMNAGPDRLSRIGTALKPLRSNSLPMLKGAFDANEGIPSLQLRIACLIGIVDPVGFENLGVSERLTDWLVDFACFDDPVGWSRLTHEVRKSMIPPLVRRYELSGSGKVHDVAYHMLMSFLEKEPIEQVVAAIMVSQPEELGNWTRLLARNTKRALESLAERRQGLGVEFALDSQGESKCTSCAKLLLVEYGLGNTEVVWPHLKIVGDTRIRDYFVHQLPYTEFSINPLVNRVLDKSDPSIQYALLLAICQFPQERLGRDSVAKLQAWLPDAYRTNPDCGVHSMCRWIMNQWGLSESIQAIDRQLGKEGVVDGRNWYVNPLGMPMLIVRGPIDMMTRDYAPNGKSSDMEAKLKIKSRAYRIPRSFAIATEDVTVGQYQQFRDDVQREQDRQTLHETTSSPTARVDRVSWLNTINYCRWISSKTGISESQAATCVEVDDSSFEMDYNKTGYRLPTKAEWEYCCSNAMVTKSNDGSIDTQKFGLYIDDVARPIASNQACFPNEYGMFTCLGNNLNWSAQNYSPIKVKSTFDPDAETVSLRSAMYVFGMGMNGKMSTSSNFRFAVPRSENANFGFRIAHTIFLESSALP